MNWINFVFGLPAIEILGLAAAFFTAFSSLPQSIKIIKLKRADDVSGFTFMMLLMSHILWLFYGIFQAAISILISNILAIVMVGTVLILKYFVWRSE